MGKRLSYVVNGIAFATKAAAEKHCSTILNKPSLSDEDSAFLSALIELHHERDQKIGVGIRRFFVGSDLRFGGRCFWIERIDGTRTDFSFKTCLKPPTHESDVRQALRFLITPQVMAFRDNAFFLASEVACAITGEMVTTDGAHIDHRPPLTFLALIESFLKTMGLTYERIPVKPTADGDTATYLADDEIGRAWCEYHQANAVLQVVTTRANLSQGGRRDTSSGSGDSTGA